MRGHRHNLRLIGLRQQSGAQAGKPVRDAEGRFKASPSNPPDDVTVREVQGFIGYRNRAELGEGEESDSAAHLPLGTAVSRGDELEAYGTGDPTIDGRYEITGVQSGRVMVRVLLKRRSL